MAMSQVPWPPALQSGSLVAMSLQHTSLCPSARGVPLSLLQLRKRARICSLIHARHAAVLTAGEGSGEEVPSPHPQPTVWEAGGRMTPKQSSRLLQKEGGKARLPPLAVHLPPPTCQNPCS